MEDVCGQERGMYRTLALLLTYRFLHYVSLLYKLIELMLSGERALASPAFIFKRTSHSSASLLIPEGYNFILLYDTFFGYLN